MTLRDYLWTSGGIPSAYALYKLGLTWAHATAVWEEREPMSPEEMRLIHDVFHVPLDDLEWFTRRVLAQASTKPTDG